MEARAFSSPFVLTFLPFVVRLWQAMKVLLIGGSGFIGPWLARGLQREQHSVAVLHRGNAQPAYEGDVERIQGDRNQLASARPAIERFAPDVVIDLILSSGRQATGLMRAFRGIAGRIVALSSMDVYRVFGIIQGTESGPPHPTPLTEDSPLRTRPLYSREQLRPMASGIGWIDEDYDKRDMEQAVLADPSLPATVLRLPMVYGPGDRQRRYYPLLKRMFDGRRHIIMSDEQAHWHAPRGYVENVAAAISAAAVSPRAAGRIYNVCEEPPFTELQFAVLLAGFAGWTGDFVLMDKRRTPVHLQFPGNLHQDAAASSARIRQELGYSDPVSLEEAIRRTIDWERANPPASPLPYQFNYEAEDAAIQFAAT